MDLIRIYNRTLEFSYLPNQDYMDFATFSKLAILMKLYVGGDVQTMGYLSYKDLISVGKYVQTYRLLQNNTELVVKNDIVAKNLNKGVKMENIVWTDKNMMIQMNFDMGALGNRIGIDQLYLIYRHFEMMNESGIPYPFVMNYTEFSHLLSKHVLLEKLKIAVDGSAKAYESQGLQIPYFDIIARILDLNNNTYIETYELLVAHKVVSLFNALSGANGVINKLDDKTISEKLKGFNDKHIHTVIPSDIEYLVYINYKFNKTGMNFHTFLFLMFDRLRNTDKLVLVSDIRKYLIFYGLTVSQDKDIEIRNKLKINENDYASYTLVLQQYIENYSNNF
jgi:hypothetical protein